MAAPFGFDFGFRADGLAVFMAMVSSFVAAIIVLYSFSYISHYENQNEYYLMVVLFIGAMMGLVYSHQPHLPVYLLGNFGHRLLAVDRLLPREGIRAAGGQGVPGHRVRRADDAAGLHHDLPQTGTFDMIAAEGRDTSPTLAVMLILFGILSKSATLPLHTWLPDAGVAPSPVTSLLHAAVLVKIGVYAFARLFLVTFRYRRDLAHRGAHHRRGKRAGFGRRGHRRDGYQAHHRLLHGQPAGVHLPWAFHRQRDWASRAACCIS